MAWACGTGSRPRFKQATRPDTVRAVFLLASAHFAEHDDGWLCRVWTKAATAGRAQPCPRQAAAPWPLHGAYGEASLCVSCDDLAALAPTRADPEASRGGIAQRLAAELAETATIDARILCLFDKLIHPRARVGPAQPARDRHARRAGPAAPRRRQTPRPTLNPKWARRCAAPAVHGPRTRAHHRRDRQAPASHRQTAHGRHRRLHAQDCAAHPSAGRVQSVAAKCSPARARRGPEPTACSAAISERQAQGLPHIRAILHECHPGRASRAAHPWAVRATRRCPPAPAADPTRPARRSHSRAACRGSLRF